MSKIDVFISYKREERALADQVSRALTKAGYVAVTDLNIQKATDFGEAIDGMIRAAKLVVVLWTRASAASDWVRTEAREGKRLGKYYGVRVEAVEPDDIPVEVRNIQWLDLSERGLTKGLPDLTEEILRKLGEAERSQQAAEEAIKRIQADLEFYQVVDKIGDIGGYKKYLEVYPDGAYAEDAASKIAQQNTDMDARAFKDAQDIGAVGGYKKYLAEFPQGAFAADANTFLRNLDDRAYADAKETGAVGGYKKYLEQFPKGRFVSDAKTFIRNHTGWRGGLRSVLPYLALVSAGAALVGVYMTLFPPASDDTDSLKADNTQLMAQVDALTTEKNDLEAELDQAQTLAETQAEKIAELETTLAAQPRAPDCTRPNGAPGISIPQAIEYDGCVPLYVTELDLTDTDFSDVEALSGLTGLQELYLDRTGVSDVSTLSSLTNLHWIVLPDGTRAGDWQNDTPEARAAVQEAIANWRPAE